MVEKYCDGVVPGAEAGYLEEQALGFVAAYHDAMDGSHGYLLHEGLRAAFALVTRGNEHVQEAAPWKLAKDPQAAALLHRHLADWIRQLARVAVMLAPFMPTKAQELWTQLGGPGRVADQRFDALRALDVAGWSVAKGSPLFPKPEKPAA
jgi:methionyl-tRNA synthetase